MISILYPSRSRPQKARDTLNDWVNNSSTEIEIILSLDIDDPTLSRYTQLFPEVKTIVNKNRSLVDATNNAAKESKGDLIVLISDDMFSFPGWDKAILEAVEGKTDFLLKTYDTIQSWICTLPICDRKYYERLGYIYHPDYYHMYCDTHMTHLAEAQGKMIIRNDITFRHDNPSYRRDRANTDRLHLRNNGTNLSGEKIYLRMLREMQTENIDIWNLSKEAEAAGHIEWLKRRIRK